MPGIDPQTFASEFEEAAPALVLYARQWLDLALAEDVVQDVFLRLLAQNRVPPNLRAWLFTCVRNAAISAHRSHSRRRHREQAVALESSPWFQRHAGDLIDAAAAQRALETLSMPQREVVTLRIWAQMTFAEIARLTGLPLSTAHHAYNEGLTAIRSIMESSCRNKT